MRKFIVISLTLLWTIVISGCGQTKQAPEIQPDITQVKAICELATMDCYFHNVAKYKEEDATGMFIWKKDRHFWIEYSGVVRIGIDTSLVTMEIEGEEVTISIPPAKILSSKVDAETLTKDSFIVAGNSAKIEAEHETQAFKEAQSNMEQTAKEDTALLASAQQRAQALLEDYVTNLGNTIGKTYTIKWKYLAD